MHCIVINSRFNVPFFSLAHGNPKKSVFLPWLFCLNEWKLIKCRLKRHVLNFSGEAIRKTISQLQTGYCHFQSKSPRFLSQIVVVASNCRFSMSSDGQHFYFSFVVGYFLF